MLDPKGCGHGKVWEQRCIECEIISASEMLWAHKKAANRARAKLEELNDEKRRHPEG